MGPLISYAQRLADLAAWLVDGGELRLDSLRQHDVVEALLAAPTGLRQPERYREGGYIRRLPQDPWGNPYQYVQPGARGPFDVFSFGSDGQPGGEKTAADIGNWREPTAS